LLGGSGSVRRGWRGIATRYDKHFRNYRAGIIVASIVQIWLR
jgi:hypothetical protein